MSSKKYSVTFYEDNHLSIREDSLIEEEPLQIMINKMPFSVTMRTPGADSQLVNGLLYTEKIIHADTKISCTQEKNHENSSSMINVTIPFGKILKNKLPENRTLISSSSCGLCGKTDVNDLIMKDKPLSPKQKLTLHSLENMYELMKKKQLLFTETGGSHAAAAFDKDFNLLEIFEDIGRHNAVDKVIGALIQKDRLNLAEILLVSGRISYEIVSKTYLGGIPFLVAVSAPSSMSIEIAKNLGISIIGFCRGNRATVYSHVQNIKV